MIFITDSDYVHFIQGMCLFLQNYLKKLNRFHDTTYLRCTVCFINLIHLYFDVTCNKERYQLVLLKFQRLYLSNHEGKCIEASKEANSNTDEKHEA